MAEHEFHLKAVWPGGRNSEGYIEAGNLQTKISIPSAMEGPNVGTNPDEMLLGAAATCYIITLAAMIERAHLPLENMSLESIGFVDVTMGVFTYKKIIHKPTVSLKQEASATDFEKLNVLIVEAERNCMISKAIKGNVDVEVEPIVSKSQV
ncbi:OsmC family protein [Sporosarcina sp. SAFN-010]|uniref:OsmC family protein n=1 Tax=Sporosarcina sp. SAFN-010 TaxID=3387273 RepID=UPI003F7E0B9D